jgi:hypothetical protein
MKTPRAFSFLAYGVLITMVYCQYTRTNKKRSNMTREIAEMLTEVREDLQRRLADGTLAGESARLLADLEAEVRRRSRADEAFSARVADLIAPAGDEGGLVGRRFLERPHPVDVDERASEPSPGAILPITPSQTKRAVVYSFSAANPTFDRAIIERLAPSERIRMQTSNHGCFEMTRDEFEKELANIASSASYRTGPPAAPGTCRYTTGRVPPALEKFRCTD